MTTDSQVTSEDLQLFHYGTKGMKWGVRKDSSSGGSANGRNNKRETRPAKDSNRAEKLKTRSRNTLSNNELKEINKRLSLEQEYSRLTAQKSTIDKGHDYVKKGLDYSRTAIQVYQVATHPATKAGLNFIKNAASSIAKK